MVNELRFASSSAKGTLPKGNYRKLNMGHWHNYNVTH